MKKLKYIALIVFAAILAFVIAGCGGPNISEGIVVDKWDIPAHNETSTTYIKMGSILTPVTSVSHIGPRYYIQISGQLCNKNGVCKTKNRDVRVSRAVYDKMELGQDYHAQS